MPRKATGSMRLDEPTLTASDWIEAALQLIAEAGFRAFTVETLAARLGVTKGSFYWHFNSRAELVSNALKRWQHRVTTEAIASLSAVPNARQRLIFMLDAASQPPRSRSLYAALAAAADEPGVRPILNRVASARIEYLEVCYRELGLSPSQARAKSFLSYAAYRGLLQLAHEAPALLPDNWSTYAETVRQALGPPPPPKRHRHPDHSAPS